MKRMKNLLSLSMLVLLNVFMVNAEIVKVKSVAELQSAIDAAKKGDVIELSDNSYSNIGQIKIDVSGITVKATTLGGVIFNGKSSFSISGNNNTVSGFQFKNINIGEGEVCEIRGNYNILTQCNFFNCTSKHYIHTFEGSHDNEISYCNIEAKPPIMNGNCAIQVTTSVTVVNRTKIRYCTFLNFGGEGGDFGNEPIRIGLGVEQNNNSGCIVEYCYFENVGLGDSESISLKSTFNVIRYNTCNNNPKAQFVFRTGNKNSAYGNFFINSGGIRIKEGGNHMIYNNYFEGTAEFPSLELMNFKLNQKTKVGEPLNNIFVYNNTFYNAGLVKLGGVGENPPKNVKIANNIFYKTAGTILADPNNNAQFINNLFYGSADLGIKFGKTEFIKVDPLLEKNNNGFYGLTVNSPAINKSDKNYPSILKNEMVENDANLMFDIEGQPRPADKTQKDIGCDEFSTEKAINHPLKKSQAGPSYLANSVSIMPIVNKTSSTVNNITDTASFENDYFKVLKNIDAENVKNARVIVALSNVKIKSVSKNVSKIARGELVVYQPGEDCKVTKGEFIAIIVKQNHPALKGPEKWIEPTGNRIVYEDNQFRVFKETLDPGAIRELHSHAQRVSVRLNQVNLRDPRFDANTLPGAGIQEANTFKYAESTVHVVKNLSDIPLNNIIVEFKTIIK